MKFTVMFLAAAMTLAVLLVSPVVAQSPDEAIISQSSIWYDLWMIIQPLVAILVTTIGPVLVGWIAVRLTAFLKIADERQRMEIEAGLRDALHKSAENGLRFAITKSGASVPFGTITGTMVSQAVNYVAEKNPEALQKLKVDGGALRDIVISKAAIVSDRDVELKP